MTTIANFMITPVVSLKTRFGDRVSSSALDTPPPPVDTTKQWDFVVTVGKLPLKL